MKNPVHLLETTLRDGSYEVDFQFTTADTAVIVSALDRAGVSYIELCHGCGFGADRFKLDAFRPKNRAAASDEAHLEVACSVAERAALGVFMTPGPDFSPLEDLATVARLGGRFVRLGFFPSDLTKPSCLDYVNRGKELGLQIALNLMQTYTLSPAEVAKGAAEVARRGGDWFYVVDSAGGMTASAVQEYVHAIREESGITVGLHAHNNSGIALANSLAAVAAGATMVDGTLQGMGRATGNAPTEQLLLALQRMGHEPTINRTAVLQLGEAMRSLFLEKGNNPTYFVSGSVQLHSRFIPILFRLAEESHKEPREFIYQMGLELHRGGFTGKDFPPEMVQSVRERTPSYAPSPPSEKLVAALAGGFERTSSTDLKEVCETLFIRSKKRHKASTLHLVNAADFPYRGPLPWESEDQVGLSVPFARDTVAPKILADRVPAVTIVDEALRGAPALPAMKVVLFHPFRALLAEAVVELVGLCRASQPGASAPVWAPRLAEPLRSTIVRQLEERSIAVATTDPGGEGRILVVDSPDASWIEAVRASDVVVLLGGSPDLRSVVDRVRAQGGRVFRPALGPAIAGKASFLVAVERRLREPMEAREFGALRGVDPLVAPASGEIVIDNLASPSQILDPGESPLAEAVRPFAAARAARLLSGKASL